jgi:hypothetical protein
MWVGFGVLVKKRKWGKEDDGIFFSWFVLGYVIMYSYRPTVNIAEEVAQLQEKSRRNIDFELQVLARKGVRVIGK